MQNSRVVVEITGDSGQLEIFTGEIGLVFVTLGELAEKYPYMQYDPAITNDEGYYGYLFNSADQPHITEVIIAPVGDGTSLIFMLSNNAAPSINRGVITYMEMDAESYNGRFPRGYSAYRILIKRYQGFLVRPQSAKV